MLMWAARMPFGLGSGFGKVKRSSIKTSIRDASPDFGPIISVKNPRLGLCAHV